MDAPNNYNIHPIVDGYFHPIMDGLIMHPIADGQCHPTADAPNNSSNRPFSAMMSWGGKVGTKINGENT